MRHEARERHEENKKRFLIPEIFLGIPLRETPSFEMPDCAEVSPKKP